MHIQIWLTFKVKYNFENVVLWSASNFTKIQVSGGWNCRPLGNITVILILYTDFKLILWTTSFGTPFEIHLMWMPQKLINSLAPGRLKVNFRWVIFKLILVVNGWGICCETVLIWMSLDHIYDKSTLVQVMAWCRQATCHYLSQCWPRSMSPNGITRPQWVNQRSMLDLVTSLITWANVEPDLCCPMTSLGYNGLIW